MGDLRKLREKRDPGSDTFTHINLGGIRYLALAPEGALRQAIREYLDTSTAPQSDTLRYLAEQRSAVMCREDWETVLSAADGAVRDQRLSTESRNTFARIRDVLNRAIPVRPSRGTVYLVMNS